MPQGYKDSGAIAAEVKMTRLVHGGAFLIVEGVTDLRFWLTRRHPTCELVDGEGKANVVGGVRKLDSENVSGVMGVVDDDFGSIIGAHLGSPNILHTDAYDLDALLCRSSALEKVLAECGNVSKLRKFERSEGVDVRQGLLHRALVFGQLRLAAALYDLELDGEAIRVHHFVDVRTWAIDQNQLIRRVVGPDVIRQKKLAKCIGCLPAADPWRVARGHDLIDLLRVGLLRVLGDMQPSVGRKQIAGFLRAGFSTEDLQATKLWADMNSWESRNQSFLVLPD